MRLLMLCLFSLAVVATADEWSLDDILRDGNNAFTAKMFAEVVKEKPNQSVVLSAFSVLTPLAQVALASVGESHDELLATIGMPNDNVTMAVFSKVNNHLRSVKGVTLKTASKIYVAKNYEIDSNFAEITRDVFGSEFANLDFTDNEKSAQEVNVWVEKQINNRIKDLVNPSDVDGSTKTLLVNAIYFKGLWEIPFKKTSTSKKNFYVNKEKIIQVPTMSNEDNYRYIDSQDLNAQVIELKYKGGEAALYIVLPHEIDGITKLEEKLTDPSLLDNIIDSMRKTRVQVYLPKLKIETTTDLKQVLKNINVKKLFNEEESRLDNLLKDVNSGLYISDAKQKAFIEVNEEGAEAAAANVLETILLFGVIESQEPTPIFNADRPFYFVVKENNLSLFNGIYAIFSLAVVATADEWSLDDILRDGNNAFTAKMFAEVVKEKPNQSVVLSAFSVLTPLAQVALASVGESHDELLATIGMPNDNVTMAVFSKVNNHLRSVKGVTLKTASKIYVAKNYEIDSNFAEITRDVFGSEFANLDFTDNEKSAQEVNVWVEKQINNRIKDLVNPSDVDGSTKTLLVNAIYFKGLWEIPFKKTSTSKKNFYVNKEKIIQVPTMSNEDNYRYIDSQDLNAQVIELKYKGGEAALYIVLPHEIDGITKLEEKLTDPSLLDNIIDSMRKTRVQVYLPKLKIETTTDLKQVLKNINVKKLFNEEESRLDNLLKDVNSGLYISDAKQKAFIEVNEEGAEAAAANVLETILLFGVIESQEPTPIFNADRPFYFVVKENNLSLFNGIYASN